MIRPVRNIGFDKIEMIGTFEQVLLHNFLIALVSHTDYSVK